MDEDDPNHSSNFIGQVFHASDSYLFRKKKTFANPLYNGTDIAALNRAQERIEELQQHGELPSSYNVHNPVQLMAERTFDTTNRSIVVGAQKNAFDPDGFRAGRPLQKTIFYMDPFITCQWCNMVTFVDVMAIRRSLALPDDVSKSLSLNLESLPPCRRCGKAEYLEVGSHDFSELIANREKVAAEKARRELAACRVIQRAYREHLRRAYARAAAAARLALAKLQAKAATRINSCARYRLAGRRVRTERYLLKIKTAHPVLLAYALRQPKKSDRRFNSKAKTFWFEREIELNMAFRNYVELAERLGWQPTRAQMEANFAEISKRIVARQDDLLSLVQRAWRGFMARRIVMYYRTEVIRLRQFLLSKAFKIQRLWRGHRVRLNIVPRMKKHVQREKQMKEYQDATDKKRMKKERADTITLTKAAYIKERAEERTARFTGRIDLATDHQDRKMRAFAASVYADNRLQTQMDNLLNAELDAIANDKEAARAAHERKAFILNRIAETGPPGLGKRSEMPDISTAVINNGFIVGGPLMPSRSRSMKMLLHHEVVDIMGDVIERATHNFTIPNLHNRLKEFNAERPVSKRVGSPDKSKLNKDSKVTKPGLDGLLSETSPSKKGSRGSVVAASMTKKQRSQLLKQQQEIDDDLGGTGSAFDQESMQDYGLGRDDVEIDDDEDAFAAMSRSAADQRKRLDSPNTKGLTTSESRNTSSPAGGNRRANSPGTVSKLQFKNSGMGSAAGGWAQGKGIKTYRKFKDYKYPTGINDDPMAYLDEGMDIILAFADKQAQKQKDEALQEQQKSVQLRSKVRKKAS